MSAVWDKALGRRVAGAVAAATVAGASGDSLGAAAPPGAFEVVPNLWHFLGGQPPQQSPVSSALSGHALGGPTLVAFHLPWCAFSYPIEALLAHPLGATATANANASAAGTGEAASADAISARAGEAAGGGADVRVVVVDCSRPETPCAGQNSDWEPLAWGDEPGSSDPAEGEGAAACNEGTVGEACEGELAGGGDCDAPAAAGSPGAEEGGEASGDGGDGMGGDEDEEEEEEGEAGAFSSGGEQAEGSCSGDGIEGATEGGDGAPQETCASPAGTGGADEEPPEDDPRFFSEERAFGRLPLLVVHRPPFDGGGGGPAAVARSGTD